MTFLQEARLLNKNHRLNSLNIFFLSNCCYDKLNKIIPHKVPANVSTPLQFNFIWQGCLHILPKDHEHINISTLKSTSLPLVASHWPLSFFTITNVAVISGYQATMIWCQTFCVVSVLGGWLIWLLLLDCILKDRLKK